MRNFIPLSLFAAAASLAVLNTLSLSSDRVAASPYAPLITPAASDAGAHFPSSPRPAMLQLANPRCAYASCSLRRPMT